MVSSPGGFTQNLIFVSCFPIIMVMPVLTGHVEEGIVAMFIAPHPAEGPLQAPHPETR